MVGILPTGTAGCTWRWASCIGRHGSTGYGDPSSPSSSLSTRRASKRFKIPNSRLLEHTAHTNTHTHTDYCRSRSPMLHPLSWCSNTTPCLPALPAGVRWLEHTAAPRSPASTETRSPGHGVHGTRALLAPHFVHTSCFSPHGTSTSFLCAAYSCLQDYFPQARHTVTPRTDQTIVLIVSRATSSDTSYSSTLLYLLYRRRTVITS